MNMCESHKNLGFLGNKKAKIPNPKILGKSQALGTLQCNMLDATINHYCTLFSAEMYNLFT